jgi:hypothetical protein
MPRDKQCEYLYQEAANTKALGQECACSVEKWHRAPGKKVGRGGCVRWYK